MKETTQKLIQYLEHINKKYQKRKITVSSKIEGGFLVRIDRDDFGSWSGDNGFVFETEEELVGFLRGFISFYDSFSHTLKL